MSTSDGMFISYLLAVTEYIFVGHLYIFSSTHQININGIPPYHSV